MTLISKLKITIVDYQLGNLFSVKHACEKMDCIPRISSSPEDILNSDGIILPGVGAFKAAMTNLTGNGLDQALIEYIKLGKPLMGVCLGMQLLFEYSEEFGYCQGLGVIPGMVSKFNIDISQNIKVPQIAWNTIKSPDNLTTWDDTPLVGVEQNEFMYFVHSFYAKPTNSAHILAKTTYHNTTYCSAVKSGNVFATQFHPEKSGSRGLLIYKNWFNQIIE